MEKKYYDFSANFSLTTMTRSLISNPTPKMDGPATLVHVRAHWAGIQPNSPIYGLFFSGIRLLAAYREEGTGSGGRIFARLPVMPIHVNSKQILHGAVSAALVDWAGGMAIAAATGRDQTGVSVDIHVSYVSAARAGDELEIEAWVQRVGQTLAYTSVEIRRLTDPGCGDEVWGTGLRPRGPVVASGSHTKYVGYAEPKRTVTTIQPAETATETATDTEHHAAKTTDEAEEHRAATAA